MIKVLEQNLVNELAKNKDRRILKCGKKNGSSIECDDVS